MLEAQNKYSPWKYLFSAQHCRAGLMRLQSTQSIGLAFLLGCALMYVLLQRFPRSREGFEDNSRCSCGAALPPSNCPPVPDLSKYVLKTSIPPCAPKPDMDNYMLKSECPPTPDLSQYVLKTSIPKQQPIIIDTSEERKAKCGECPPCPRPPCPPPSPRPRAARPARHAARRPAAAHCARPVRH